MRRPQKVLAMMHSGSYSNPEAAYLYFSLEEGSDHPSLNTGTTVHFGKGPTSPDSTMEVGHEYAYSPYVARPPGNQAYVQAANGMSRACPLEGIEFPGSNDVMMGRGGGTNTHIGNIRFRQLVHEHKRKYIMAHKTEKPKVAWAVVQTWRALDPPGRFLARSDPEMGDDSYWHDVGDKEARKKASQCLRERTPDVLPILKSLKENETKEKDKNEQTDENNQEKAKLDKTESKPDKTESKLRPTPKHSRKKKEAQKSDGRNEIEWNPYQVETANEPTSTDLTPSQVPTFDELRQSLVKERKRRNIREEVSDAVPSAASLVEEVFGRWDANDEELLDQSNRSFVFPWQELMEEPVGSEIDADSSTVGSSAIMDSLSTSTWFRSFRSMENSSQRTPMSHTESLLLSQDGVLPMSVGGSLRGIVEECDDSISALDLAMPGYILDRSGRSASSRKVKIGTPQPSNYSLLSDLTGDSSHGSRHGRRGSSRSNTLKSSQGPSGRTMLSELTDMSDSIRGMDLAL